MIINIVLIIAALLAAAIAGILIIAACKPNSFRIERSREIQAPPEKIFALINDFRRWASWSPWEKMDPGLKRTFSGAESGKGAVYEWEGNKQVGSGRMEILESLAPLKVAIKLDFLKPFEAHHTAEFALAPQDNKTRVTWTMFGRQPFLFKVMCLFFSMDKMVGKDFEAGLANLKAIVEG